MEEHIAKLLEHGFAVAVATYLLLRTDKRMEEMKNAVVHLAAVIERKSI